MEKIKITLRRSTCNIRGDQVATIRALGLKKIGSSVKHDDIPEIRGMVNKVSHLIEVEEI